MAMMGKGMPEGEAVGKVEADSSATLRNDNLWVGEKARAAAKVEGGGEG